MKAGNDSMYLIFCGRAFQTDGAQKEKERSPKDFVRVDGFSRILVSDDERRFLDGEYIERQEDR